ncbi:expressed unknown protein [Seminavis robusta]|uniref:Uncharacterized protein n=1 Tax=Seminavis robusta TaxID=568900 RepID=A0A9N8DZJ6_9STRA|nr:expressed unknown protein [Seminavis robusta]|eukprot:Sro391_g133150.1 n/a (702) ;mRNA; f:51157-53432
MPGMPDQGNGLNHDSAAPSSDLNEMLFQVGAGTSNNGTVDMDTMQPYSLMAENPLKRNSDIDEESEAHSESSKRSRLDNSHFDDTQNMSATSNSLLSDHEMGSTQSMSVAGNFGKLSVAGNFGNMTTSEAERCLDDELNRQQQQSATLFNDMTMMTQQMGMFNGNGTGALGNMAMQGNGPARSQQQMWQSNPNSFNSNQPAFGQMQGVQNLQGMPQFSSMGNQQLFSGMLDYTLLNNRLSQQTGFNGLGAAPASSSSMMALNQSFNQMPMQAASMGQQQWQSGFSGNTAAQATNQAANNTQPFSTAGMLQLARMSGSSQPQAALPQGMVPHQQQQQSRGMMNDMFCAPTQRQQQQQLPPLQRQMPMMATEGTNSMLPPFEEAQTPHFSQRPYFPFSVEEDSNWLSEFQCFIRSEILELFRVSKQGIKVRNAVKTHTVGQVGIRCRFCAHLQHGTRANRASCFPSKIDKIYQSFTMMLREHFPHCPEMPENIKSKFVRLQNMNAQGASNAKGYWAHAAKKKGLVDVTEDGRKGGIHIFERSFAEAALIPPFGTEDFAEPQPPVTLINRSDRGLVSGFLFALMEQVYRVHLAPSEKKGNRKSLPDGMPGFGCKYCFEAGRMGLCRQFPARRRTIHNKIPDLFDHMKRCPLCPQEVKDNLIALHREENAGGSKNKGDPETATHGNEREFYERIWNRLGHQDNSE